MLIHKTNEKYYVGYTEHKEKFIRKGIESNSPDILK